METEYIKYFLLAFILSAAIIPLIILISKKLNLYDFNNFRKLHTVKVSRLGGAAVIFSFMVIALYTLPDYSVKFNIYLYFLAAFMAVIPHWFLMQKKQI